jgi:hypothetical protein
MINQLILHPVRHDAAIDADRLLHALRAIGLIGAAFSFEGNNHHRPGDRLLQLITFLGCSPVVSLGEPGLTGDEFCHLQFEGTHPAPIAVAGDNLKPARCPGCKHTLKDSPKRIAHWPEQTEIHCPQCGTRTPLPRLNWRRSAGFGRFFLRIWGVFESEAVPADELLAALEQASDLPWSYFYYRDNATKRPL